MYDHYAVDRRAQEWEIGTAFEKLADLNSYKLSQKKVFIHQDKNVWEIIDMKVNVKKNKLMGHFVPVDTAEYKKYIYYSIRESENNRIKNYTDEKYAANQTHIVIYDSIIFHRDTVNEIKFTDVADIKDFRHFLGKERGVQIVSTLIPIAAGVTAWLIALSFLGGVW